MIVCRDAIINGKNIHFWDGYEELKEGYMVMISVVTNKSPHMTYPHRAKVLKITTSGRVKLEYRTKEGEMKQTWRSSDIFLSAEKNPVLCVKKKEA